MAALAATKIARTVLVLDRLPRAEAPFRIDAVPARTLALLADFGIDPRAIGADTLSRGQNACWETETPRWSDARPRTSYRLGSARHVSQCRSRIHIEALASTNKADPDVLK